MNPRFDAPKPEIKVFNKKNAVHSFYIREVVLGIEEEGLPYDIEEKTGYATARELAYKAAEASHLGVGIGISDKGIAIHTNKLKEDQPLFDVKLSDDEEVLRAMGANAARLIKRMPFKIVE